MLPGTLEVWRDAMGMDWPDSAGLANAIPPAYTEHIGRQLIEAL
jgi:DNA (cytosine-5)-methyltransferase 1